MAEESQYPPSAKLIRGTTVQNDYFTGPDGSLSVDTEKQQLRLHDGETQGGTPIPSEAPEDGKAYIRKDGVWTTIDIPEQDLGNLDLYMEPFNQHTYGEGRATFYTEGSAYIDNDGRLWVAGILGDWAGSAAVEVYSSTTYQEILPEKRFKMVSSDRQNPGFMALDVDGYIWVMGNNENGKLGRADDGTHVWPPEKLNEDNDWVYVKGAEYQVGFGIKADGTLWSWGDGSHGQLGRLDPDTGEEPTGASEYTPGQVGTLDGWTHIVANHWAVVGYRANGEVYWWGWDAGNSAPDPDHPENYNLLTPYLVDTYEPGTTNKLGIMPRYTVHIRPDGTLWVTGDRTEFDPESTQTADWVQIGTKTDWDFVASGSSWNGMVLVDLQGDAYVYGELYWRQYFPEPTKLTIPEPVVAAYMCYQSYFFVLTAEGKLYGNGENWAGQLGIDYTIDDTRLEPIPTEGTYEWVLGDNWMSIALRTDGVLVKMGGNDNGSLGCGSGYLEIDSPTPIDQCPV